MRASGGKCQCVRGVIGAKTGSPHAHFWAELHELLTPKEENGEKAQTTFHVQVGLLDATAKLVDVNPASFIIGGILVANDAKTAQSKKLFAKKYFEMSEEFAKANGVGFRKEAVEEEATRLFELTPRLKENKFLRDSFERLSRNVEESVEVVAPYFIESIGRKYAEPLKYYKPREQGKTREFGA